MPSDKHKLIRLYIAKDLIYSLIKVASFRDVPFRQPTAVAPMLAYWFYQSLPLFSFVLHPFLPYCVGDNLGYARYGFSVRLG